MTRQSWVLVHRYFGLVMALFLLVAGLTGGLLAFNDELDEAVNAAVMRVAPPSPPDARPMEPLILRDMVETRFPDAWVHWVDLAPKPGHALSFWLEGPTDPSTGQHGEIPNNQIFVNPYTGEILGARKWGDITQGLTNVMPFLYRLHYSLALGTVGEYIFGVVGFLWTLDCFVGAYLTFPASRRHRDRRSGSLSLGLGEIERRSWLAQWWQSWKIRWNGGDYKVNFDLHRAGGLWPWAMLLVLAWSSVGFNLKEVYKPVMNTLFLHQTELEAVPKLSADQPQPGIPWAQAFTLGHTLMEAEAHTKGFEILQPWSLSYDPHKGLYRYAIKSDRDIADRWGGTILWFDAITGERRAAYLPSGEASGDTVSSWLFALHMAAVWGLPFQIFMSIMGLTVALLSVTGVVIWRKKHLARQTHLVRTVHTRVYSSRTIWDS